MIPKVKLGDLITITGGGTPSKSNESFWNGEIPWMSVKDLRGNIVYNTTDTITPKGLANSASNLVKKGTLVMATRMAVGKAVYAGVDLAINQDLKAFYLKPGLFHRYLFYQLRSKQSYFENHSTGATVKGITLDVIKQLDILLPPLEEQKKIAAILDAADAYRQKTKALIDKYDRLTQSLFLDMFGDPVTNPKGWEMAFLETCLQKIDKIGKGFSQDSIHYVDIASVDNIRNVIKEITFYNTCERPNRAQQILLSGDIIFSTVRPNLKNIAINHVDGRIGSTGFFVCRTNPDKLNNLFLYNVLLSDSATDYFVGITSGANYPAVKSTDMRKFQVIIPPLDIQNQFAEKVEQIEKQKQQAEAALVKAEELFNSLLQRAFKGELTN